MDLGFSVVGGRTVLSRRRFQWPYEVGRVTYQSEGDAQVIVQSGAGSAISGDVLHMRMTAYENAQITVLGQGALSLNRAVNGVGVEEKLTLVGHQGSSLKAWLPPRLLFPNAVSQQTLVVDVSDNARVVGLDSVVFHPSRGRRCMTQRLEIRRSGRLISVEEARYAYDGEQQYGGSQSMAHDFAAHAVIVAVGFHPPAVRGRVWWETAQSFGVAASMWSLRDDIGVAMRVAAPDGGSLRTVLDAARELLNEDIAECA